MQASSKAHQKRYGTQTGFAFMLYELSDKIENILV